METKEEISKNLDDEQMFKKIEQHNRNINVAVSMTIVAIMLIGVIVMRMYLMKANAQEVTSEIEMKFEEDVRNFKQNLANQPKENLISEDKKAEVPIINHQPSTFNHQPSKFANLHIDINTADTAELRKLPGIGEKRALNIVKFRTSLGGFYSVEQLAEVYSMDATLVERLKKYLVCKGDVAKIDINNTNPYKLWHPYLKGDLIKNIKKNLKSGKKYKSFEDIKAEEGFNEELNGRAERYLEFK